MKRFASSILLCSLLTLGACESIFDGESPCGDEAMLVNLDVRVSLADVSDAKTRSDGSEAVGDNEKMSSLRIVIVRPDWTVEANRLVDLQAATLRHEMERFKVFGDEEKLIYLFVNEDAVAPGSDLNLPRKLVDYDFGEIQVGDRFPVNDIEGLRIRLDSDTERIEGPLPMSESHRHFVTREAEQSCELFVTRAAVKFTFHFINDSGTAVTVDRLAINKMAREEWYMPRAKYAAAGEGTVNMEITDYEVPAGVGYYVFDYGLPSAWTVEAKGDKYLDPIYLLEGKYSEDRYSLDISLDKVSKNFYFNNLETLPRNTHVVVNVTFDMDSKISCEVDVIPYGSVPLDPGFGL